jgi:hypothetical protein
MDRDRTEICNIVSEMLDNPNEYGIFPTTDAFEKLEKYVEKVRAETLGWMYAKACYSLDNGEELRLMEVPSIYSEMIKDFSKETGLDLVETIVNSVLEGSTDV